MGGGRGAGERRAHHRIEKFVGCRACTACAEKKLKFARGRELRTESWQRLVALFTAARRQNPALWRNFSQRLDVAAHPTTSDANAKEALRLVRRRRRHVLRRSRVRHPPHAAKTRVARARAGARGQAAHQRRAELRRARPPRAAHRARRRRRPPRAARDPHRQADAARARRAPDDLRPARRQERRPAVVGRRRRDGRALRAVALAAALPLRPLRAAAEPRRPRAARKARGGQARRLEARLRQARHRQGRRRRCGRDRRRRCDRRRGRGGLGGVVVDGGRAR